MKRRSLETMIGSVGSKVRCLLLCRVATDGQTECSDGLCVCARVRVCVCVCERERVEGKEASGDRRNTQYTQPRGSVTRTCALMSLRNAHMTANKHNIRPSHSAGQPHMMTLVCLFYTFDPILAIGINL